MAETNDELVLELVIEAGCLAARDQETVASIMASSRRFRLFGSAFARTAELRVRGREDSTWFPRKAIARNLRIWLSSGLLTEDVVAAFAAMNQSGALGQVSKCTIYVHPAPSPLSPYVVGLPLAEALASTCPSISRLEVLWSPETRDIGDRGPCSDTYVNSSAIKAFALKLGGTLTHLRFDPIVAREGILDIARCMHHLVELRLNRPTHHSLMRGSLRALAPIPSLTLGLRFGTPVILTCAHPNAACLAARLGPGRIEVLAGSTLTYDVNDRTDFARDLALHSERCRIMSGFKFESNDLKVVLLGSSYIDMELVDDARIIASLMPLAGRIRSLDLGNDNNEPYNGRLQLDVIRATHALAAASPSLEAVRLNFDYYCGYDSEIHSGEVWDALARLVSDPACHALRELLLYLDLQHDDMAKLAVVLNAAAAANTDLEIIIHFPIEKDSSFDYFAVVDGFMGWSKHVSFHEHDVEYV